MTMKCVKVTMPNQTVGRVTLESPTLAKALLHAAGGGFTEEQTAKAIEARHTLIDGGEVVLGNWRFEPVEEEEED